MARARSTPPGLRNTALPDGRPFDDLGHSSGPEEPRRTGHRQSATSHLHSAGPHTLTSHDGFLGVQMRRRWVLSTLTSVAVLAASACTTHGHESASARITRSAGGHVAAENVTVSVRPDSVSSDLTLRVRRSAIPKNLPDYITAIGKAVTITVTGGRLTGTARLVFGPSAAIKSSDLPVVTWQDGAGGWRWLPAERRADGSIAAETDHFSLGYLGKIDVPKWAKDVAGNVKDYATGRSGVEQPSCGDEGAFRGDGTSVSSDGGDTIKWCAGVQDGKRIMRVANNRRAYAQLTFPVSWTVVDGGGFGLSIEALKRSAASGAARLSAPPGTQVRLVSGGQILTLALPPGVGGHLSAEMSIVAWALSGIELGVQVWSVVAGIANKGLGTLGDTAWGRFTDRLLGNEALAGWGDAWGKCLESVTGNFTDSPMSSASISSIGSALMKTEWDCVPQLMKADVAQAGLKMFALGVLLSTIGTVTGLIFSAANLLVTGVREIWDSLAAFGGKSDPIYDVVVNGKQAAPTSSCTNGEISNAYVAWTGKTPTGVEDLRCAQGWAAAVIIDPVTGKTDGLKVFRVVGGVWKVVGEVLPPDNCAERVIANFQMPSAVFAAILPQIRPCQKVVEIPDVEGQTFDQASKVLTDAGLRTSEAYEQSDSELDGRATRTDPPAGTKVETGYLVTVYIARPGLPGD
jgi:PASTA domain-containing protein